MSESVNQSSQLKVSNKAAFATSIEINCKTTEIKMKIIYEYFFMNQHPTAIYLTILSNKFSMYSLHVQFHSALSDSRSRGPGFNPTRG